MRTSLVALMAGALALPAAAQAVDAAKIPSAVSAAAVKAMPGMTITEAELKERDGRRYYDVEGRLPNGDEIELDMLETPAGWQVVEIQRDIPWTSAPTQVRAAAPAGVQPVRVIESRQTDGSVVYELFAPGKPAEPALEVMWKDGKAKLLAERWPH